jgi:O-succinylbenzoate synthase
VGDGFADIHPWPELGDAPLAEQLARLARGETTPLTRRSLAMAQLDGRARAEGRSLFDGVTVPESHWTVTEATRDVPPAFDTVKVKMPAPLDGLERFRLRLDFNASLDAQAFAAYFAELPSSLDVDFVEDPCPYDGPTWRALRERFGVRLALDRHGATEGVDVLVVKPAIQEMPAADGREVVITSYMDHPVGQLHAAYVAAHHATSSRCGLLTHVLYEPDAFTERLAIDGLRLVPPGGSGIGFEAQLEALPWKELR